jgi:hypothetical protein
MTLWKGAVSILQRYKIEGVAVPEEIRLDARGFAEPLDPLLIRLSKKVDL